MKKRFLAITLALALCVGLTVPAFAAEDAPEPIATVKGDDVVLGDGESDSVIIKSNGKYGAYTYEGKELAAPTYTYARGYSDGMAAVTNEGAMKVIFDWGWSKEEQEQYGDDGKIWEFEDGKYGYLDESGKLAIPMKYVKAFDFADDRAFVQETENGPLLMIDKTGKTIASYDNVDLWYYETVQFSEGLAIIPVIDGEDGMEPTSYLVVDTSGKTVYTQEGGYLDFENGYHDGLVACADEGYWGTGGPCLERGCNDMVGGGYRDKTGKKVISLTYGEYDHPFQFSDGIAFFYTMTEDYEYFMGAVDTTGKVVIEPKEYTNIFNFENGCAAVSKDGGNTFAIIDKTGKLLTDFVYTHFWGFTEDGVTLARAKEGPISVVDTAGKTLFTTKDCDRGSGYYGGVSLMMNFEAGKGYVYDKEGNDITPMTSSNSFTTGTYVWLLNGNTWSVYSIADLLGDTEPAAPEFTDVDDGAYYANAVKWAVTHDPVVTNGATTTTFAPGADCTQVQILTFLWWAAGEPESKADLPVDIEGKNVNYAETALRWAAEKGMIDETFDLSAKCTRASAVTYIWQAFGSQEAEAVDFTDVAEDAAYAAAVAWAVKEGVTNGKTTTTFAPDEVCSRGQIVTFLYRAYEE